MTEALSVVLAAGTCRLLVGRNFLSEEGAVGEGGRLVDGVDMTVRLRFKGCPWSGVLLELTEESDGKKVGSDLASEKKVGASLF